MCLSNGCNKMLVLVGWLSYICLGDETFTTEAHLSLSMCHDNAEQLSPTQPHWNYGMLSGNGIDISMCDNNVDALLPKSESSYVGEWEIGLVLWDYGEPNDVLPHGGHGTSTEHPEESYIFSDLDTCSKVTVVAWRVQIRMEDIQLKQPARLWTKRRAVTMESLWGAWLYHNPTDPGNCMVDSVAAMMGLRGAPPGQQWGHEVCGNALREVCVRAWLEPWACSLLGSTAKVEGCSKGRYIADIGDSKWGGRPDLRVLAHYLKVQFRVWTLDRELLFCEGPEYDIVYDLGLAHQHYVAVKPGPVALILKAAKESVSSVCRGGAGKNKMRSTRSASSRRSPLPVRLRSRSRARPVGEQEGRRKLLELPKVPGLDHSKERSWITLKTWGVPPYVGADPYCLLCHRWCGTGHRQSEKHAKRLETYGWGPGRDFVGEEVPPTRSATPPRAILKPNPSVIKKELHEDCDGVLVIDTKEAAQVQIAVKTLGEPEVIRTKHGAKQDHSWAESAMKEQPWLCLVASSDNPEDTDLYCKLCKRWCDPQHLGSAGHAKRVHNQGPGWQDDESDDLFSQPPGKDPPPMPASSSRGGMVRTPSAMSWQVGSFKSLIGSPLMMIRSKTSCSGSQRCWSMASSPRMAGPSATHLQSSIGRAQSTSTSCQQRGESTSTGSTRLPMQSG